LQNYGVVMMQAIAPARGPRRSRRQDCPRHDLEPKQRAR